MGNSALHKDTQEIFVEVNAPEGAKGKYSINSDISSLARDASETTGRESYLVVRGVPFETCGYVEFSKLAHSFLSFIVLTCRTPHGGHINQLSPLRGHKHLGLGPQSPPVDASVLYKSNHILGVP